jgi:hypothetical protein
MTVPSPAIAATGVAVQNQTGQNVSVAVTGGTVQGIIVNYPPNAPVAATPAIPASTVAATNNNAFPVSVAITGGTVTVVAVNGVTQFTATGVTAVVPAGGTIAITYSVVPTSWVWTPVVAGVSGSPVASPSSVPVPPGCSVTLIYSAAPTWAWTNPIQEAYTPGYYAMNQLAEGSGYSPLTVLPYAQHAEGGATNLGTAVSN